MPPLVEELVPAPDPVRSCERLDGLPYRLLLDSAIADARLGRYSFLTADPVAVVRSKGGEVECLDLVTSTRRTERGDPLAVLRALVEPYSTPAVAGLPPFQGGVAGYVAYDWGLTLERLPAPRYDDLALPDVVMAVYDWVLAWDHASGQAWLISTGLPETTPSARASRAVMRAAAVKERIRHAHASPLPPAPLPPASSHPPAFAASRLRRGKRPFAPSHLVQPVWWPASLQLKSSFTRDAYLAAVERVREYVFAGDIFQANLSQRFEAPFHQPAWDFYRCLRERNAAPFAAYLDFPEAQIVSASPERFLRVDAARHVETRPIKGTRPRGVGPEHDAALGQALAESAKDRAENLMIVDL
ncbi:MAG TPA: chorismate-binding protein, partial [Vicinamibacterales bacterium]|nr:chorismate-binding protein [Vicinamibacterales bacterium]